MTAGLTILVGVSAGSTIAYILGKHPVDWVVISGLVAGAGTLVLAYYTSRSVASASSLQKLTAKSVAIATQAIVNDEHRAKREATMQLWNRFQDNEVGYKRKMTVQGAVSPVVHFKTIDELKVFLEKVRYKGLDSNKYKTQRATYFEIRSALVSVAVFFKAAAVLLDNQALDYDLFMRLFATIFIRSYDAMKMLSSEIPDVLYSQDFAPDSSLTNLRQKCVEALGAGEHVQSEIQQ